MSLIFKLLSYPRAIIGALFIVLWTLICSVVVISVIVITGRKEKAAFATSILWSRTILFFHGVEVELRGRENLPATGCLYLFNHTSHFDILAIFSASPRLCYFGAKSELFSIPVFGSAIRKAGALPIERKNREKVMQVYRDAEKRVQDGDVFALAPEGTRCDGRGTLAEFKSGPFFFAVNAQMPLVPLVLIGCENVLPKHALLANWGVWKQKVIMEILTPIYPLGRDEAQVPSLKEKSREAMLACLKKHWG
ncbi:1-acyl-sn-glycerol-3-phosphate acyltransferase [bacterium]|nr:1-acyl-sn-glycerol-3-phosphate acyltransferase [bacterium]